MADNISYKGYLKMEQDGEEEVRRFMISKDMTNNFDNLKEKLVVVFPQLNGKNISITWTDADGDNVTIASDEELMIAMSEMTGPVYKISIQVKGEKKVEEEKNSTGEIHPGVSCDGCDGPVVGARYKCMVCPDYDLCEKCEGKGQHKEHNMMRLSSPQGQWPRHFFKRLHKLQERMDQKMKDKHEGRNEEDENEVKFSGPWGRGCMRGRGGMGGMRGMRGMRGSPNMMTPPNLFNSFIQGWMGQEQCGTPTHAAAHSAHEAAHKAAAEAAHKAATEAANAATAAGGAAAVDSNAAHTAYLLNMGNLIAAALDPFDISVDVSVETPEGVRTTSSTTSSSSTASTTPAEQKTESKESTPEVDAKVIPIQKEAEAEKPKSGSATPDQDVDEAWAVVDAVPENNEKIYPKLPEAEPTPAKEDAAPETAVPAPSAPKAAQHADPKIKVALQAMMNMGFSNEGGWLASLLEAKNGDIGKVLDLLQPVKK